MPTAKNRFHILNLHPKKYILKKYPFLNANLLEKFLLLNLTFTCNKQILCKIYCRIMTIYAGVYLNLAIALKIISNKSSFHAVG